MAPARFALPTEPDPGPSSSQAGTDDSRRSRPSSIGFDFAGAVAGLTLVGWAVDRFQGTAPWGLLTGAILGIVGGLYNALKAAGVIGRKSRKP